MKVSTTSFLLASLYGSALAAPVGGDLGGALESVTSTAGLGNVAPGNIVPGNIVPGNIIPGNDLTKGLTGAVGQPGNIVGRDGEQKASAVLPNYDFVATDHAAKADIRADTINVDARNFDAKAKGVVGQLLDADTKAKAHPFAKPPADVNVDANVEARNFDAKAKGIVGQLLDADTKAKAHPFAKPPADVNIDATVDALNGDAKPSGAVDQLTDAVASGGSLADNIAEPTGSVDSALEDATGIDVSGGLPLPTGNL